MPCFFSAVHFLQKTRKIFALEKHLFQKIAAEQLGPVKESMKKSPKPIFYIIDFL